MQDIRRPLCGMKSIGKILMGGKEITKIGRGTERHNGDNKGGREKFLKNQTTS